MYFEGKINFIIRDSINFDGDICDKIGFNPTKIIRKGEELLIKQAAPYNIWIYEVKFNDINFIEKLSAFTNHLLQYKKNIMAIVLEYECVELNIYINTQYGQFGFSLPSIELSKIAELGINANFHLLSYGDIEK